MDELAAFVRSFATSMQASRIHHFGWEQSVNDLSPERMRALAKQVPEARDALLMAAEMKEANHGTA